MSVKRTEAIAATSDSWIAEYDEWRASASFKKLARAGVDELG